MGEKIKIITIDDLKVIHEREEEISRATYLKKIIEYLFSKIFHDTAYKSFSLEQMVNIFFGTIHIGSIPKELMPRYLKLKKKVNRSKTKEEFLTVLSEELF